MNFPRHFMGKTGIVLAILLLPHLSLAETHYVWLDSPGPTPPYTSWATAATNIQDAIDSASSNDLVLVTNGVYATGGLAVYGAMTNRVAITNAVTVQSVNGPSNTCIVGQGPMGDGAVRCVYVGNGAVLAGFMLTNGCTRTGGDYYMEQSGGGAWCGVSAVLSNCIFIGNSAYSSGGGAYYGTLTNCTFVGNAASSGGGAYDCMLNNCVFFGNSASSSIAGGGGASCGLRDCTLNNCTFTSNTAVNGGGVMGPNLFEYRLKGYHCTISSNSASGDGGGACGAILNDCVLSSNSASRYGGGAVSCTLSNCTLLANSAGTDGGGASCCALTNCTLSGNTAQNGGGAYVGLDFVANCVIFSNSATGNGGGCYGASFGMLSNCVLYGNSAANYGGGSYGGYLFNSTIYGNSATVYGGGSYNGYLFNCVLSGNWTSWRGGGSYGGYLFNCTICCNSATNSGGGAYLSDLKNCIVYYNAAETSSNCLESTVVYSCTTPDPGGPGNITDEPQFVDAVSTNFRLQAGSPCVNAGDNASAFGGADLDGNPRIIGGRVDMGAYESTNGTTTNGIQWGWLLQYGLATDGSADLLDQDGDRMKNLNEYVAGTDPTNALSVLRITSIQSDLTNGDVIVTWSSVSNRWYRLECSTNLETSFGGVICSNILAAPPMNTETDRTATGMEPRFYRIRVE